MWGIGSLRQLITNPVYGGRWRFNAIEARTRRRKSDAEHIFADAPAIIEPGRNCSPLRTRFSRGGGA